MQRCQLINFDFFCQVAKLNLVVSTSQKALEQEKRIAEKLQIQLAQRTGEPISPVNFNFFLLVFSCAPNICYTVGIRIPDTQLPDTC